MQFVLNVVYAGEYDIFVRIILRSTATNKNISVLCLNRAHPSNTCIEYAHTYAIEGMEKDNFIPCSIDLVLLLDFLS